MRRSIAGLIAAGSLLLGATAFAQNEEPETRFIEFPDLLIGGERNAPVGTIVTGRGDADFDTLLELRVSFVDEIIESAAEVL
jgi:hypothetical protein